MTVEHDELQRDRQQSATDAAQARWHEAALDDVVGIVMENWQYPKRALTGRNFVQFDLREWLAQTYDSHEFATIVCGFMDDTSVIVYEVKLGIMKKLRAHLSTLDLVAERAAVLAAEELQERQ